MKAEKDSKFRLTPQLREAVNRMIPLIEQSPELRAKLEYGGKVTMSRVIQEVVGRGLEDLSQSLRKALPDTGAVKAPTPPKPTKPVKTKSKPTKLKKKARK